MSTIIVLPSRSFEQEQEKEGVSVRFDAGDTVVPFLSNQQTCDIYSAFATFTILYHYCCIKFLCIYCPESIRFLQQPNNSRVASELVQAPGGAFSRRATSLGFDSSYIWEASPPHHENAELDCIIQIIQWYTCMYSKYTEYTAPYVIAV